VAAQENEMPGWRRIVRIFARTAVRNLTLFLAACGGGSSKEVDGPVGSFHDAPVSQGACSGTSTITRLPACGAAATSSVNVPAGCTPTVDGTLHQEEWTDATCFTLGSSGDTVYAKYAGGSLYLAFSATPACGCGMSFVFDPSGGSTLDGDEFALALFDDPFNTNGDRGDFVVSGGAWVSGHAPAGIDARCPGSQPNPINYEVVVPFAALGITAGTAHTVKLAIDHPNAAFWPAGVTYPASSNLPLDPSNWGQLTSSANWR
jgi:hypothetical protein